LKSLADMMKMLDVLSVGPV